MTERNEPELNEPKLDELDLTPETAAPEPARPRRASRLRRFFLRHVPLSIAGALVLLAGTVIAAYIGASSARFENFVRERMVRRLEASTGGRVEIASFHWRLLDLEADADGVVIHGLEAPTEAPWARVESLRARISILGFLSPRILLRDLVVNRPAMHLIVYEDGSTNQPHPRKPAKPGKPALDWFFDLKAGHFAVLQGELDYDDRAAAFDTENRYKPLNLDASDVSLRMAYAPPAAGNPESFHVEAAARDLDLNRGEAAHPISLPVHGYLQATLDLTRNAAYLRSLRLTARSRATMDRTLEVAGSLEDFAHPRWQAKAAGELDMRLLETIFGYPNAPEGLAHLDLTAAGQGGIFRTDGTVHIDGGSYIAPGISATGVDLDAHVHADPEQLLVTSIVARLRRGGQIDGALALDHWLTPLPGAAQLQPTGLASVRPAGGKLKPAGTIVHPPPPFVPINGKVTAQIEGVTLDTVLDIVGQGPFQRLGLDARLSGPATATWANGNPSTTVVSATLAMEPSGRPLPGEVATSGTIDGTYSQRTGDVELRRFDVHLPQSQLEAHGLLGAYPLTIPTSLAVDFHSRNLWEFDTVLRDLGLTRAARATVAGSKPTSQSPVSGTAALPVTLAGQADFHGTWNGSLVDPHLVGNAKATQLSVEMPFAPNDKAGNPQSFRFDTVEASGGYSAARIFIDHGQLHRGPAEILVNGTLTAAPGSMTLGPDPMPQFDSESLLHMHLHATKLTVQDLLPLAGQSLPVTGSLDAQVGADGAIRTLAATGWVELDGGTVFDEPVNRIRAQGSYANQVVKLTSVSVKDDAGKVTATGSYDIESRRFEIDAGAAAMDVARIDWLKKKGLAVTGKLGFTVAGSGTFDDPHLEAHATLAGLTLGGDPLGGLELTAHTANRTATYDVTTRLEAAEAALHGQTALSGDNATQARLEFSKFNIGALLKLAHVRGLEGESALAGNIAVEGPMARPAQMRGEARLQQLALTIAGVHLQSEGEVHATLANERIALDPIHITGDQTDMRGQGSLELSGKQQLDFAASGAINLKVAETIDPDLTAGGNTTFQVEAHGTLRDPGLRGSIDFIDGSLSLEDIPNGLSQLRGRLEFNQNRLEVKSLTAMSGGGLLTVGGYLAYQNGIYADLTATGKGIRIRYPEGVSSLADATLRLQGPQNNLLLGGEVLITRFTMNPDFDIAALAAQANSVQTIAPPDAPSNHIRLDVHVASSPQLNFQNAYAKLAGDVDLRLRGTVASPSLLGRVSITEGSAIIAGTRYELQRGDISFTNPVRIQPTIDLAATARVEDYDITLGVHGPLEKSTVTYRSDPPLPEADVMALLALGRTESQQRIYTQQQIQASANPTTDALLGGALNATVSSRVQKLFGAGSVKVDPNYLGALGNSTSRIIVEEQLGSNVTLTYATNVNTTAQQLIQAEIAVNHHVSLLVARDESGIFSMVLKATRRYR
jgi:translocation and assembly module TamB